MSTLPEDGELRVRLLPSVVGADGRLQYATSYLVDDALAVDAGAVGFYRDPASQAHVRDVLLTHSHADHIASLPILLENTFGAGNDCVQVWGGSEVLDCLRSDVFNDRVWPDLEELAEDGRPFVRLCELEAERAVEIAGLRITPVAVDHTVPTFGFVIEGARSSVVLCGDTGPTERIWQLSSRTPNLRAVFLETSFPDSMARLAHASGHLTPTSFAGELDKIDAQVAVIAVHLKPRYRDEIEAELRVLGDPRVEIGEPSREYRW